MVRPAVKKAIESSPPQSPRARILNSHQEQIDEIPSEEAQLDPFDLDDNNIQKQITSNERYWYYINNGIPDSELYEIKPEVFQAMHSLIPARLRNSQKLTKLSKSLDTETSDIYSLAARQAILDYILLDEHEKERLGIKYVAKSYTPQTSRGPVPWHEPYVAAKLAIEETLWITNPIMGLTKSIFAKYETIGAFNFAFLEKSVPMGIEDFILTVKSQIQAFKEMLCRE